MTILAISFLKNNAWRNELDFKYICLVRNPRLSNVLENTIMQAPRTHSIKTLVFSLSSAVISAFALNSCASDPAPVDPYPIPEPIIIPTPEDTADEVVPDPIEDQDFNNPPVDPTPVIPTTPTAKPVPGRPGFVFNPYTQNMVDVEGIPSRTKVRDPQDDDESHTFYVP